MKVKHYTEAFFAFYLVLAEVMHTNDMTASAETLWLH